VQKIRATHAYEAMNMRCDVDKEYWCMQWCGEVLPEPAMIPDLGVFLRSTPVYSQAVTIRGQRSEPALQPAQNATRQEPFPARLKLPFLLSAPVENKTQ